MRPGFLFGDIRIHFIDAQGKDASFNRWRTTLYYQTGFALTHFFYSEKEYSAFLSEKLRFCYTDYEEYKINKWRAER